MMLQNSPKKASTPDGHAAIARSSTSSLRLLFPLSPASSNSPSLSSSSPRALAVISPAIAGKIDFQAPASPTRVNPSTRFQPAAPKTPTTPARTNAALQMLLQQAASTGRAGQRIDVSQLLPRLDACRNFASLQMLAIQYQGGVDQQGIIAILKRATQVASATPNPGSQDQYACAKLLEAVALSCAPLVPAMGPPMVAAVLGAMAALTVGGRVPIRQVPFAANVLTQALVLGSMPDLHVYSGPQLAQVLRGCAVLSGKGVPEVWLDEWTSHMAPHLRSLAPDAAVGVVRTLAMVKDLQAWQPNEQWLAQLTQACLPHLKFTPGSELCHLLMALFDMDVALSGEWLDAYRDALRAATRAGSIDPADLAGVMFQFHKRELPYM